MRGRYPKAPGTRQRRNKGPGARTLSADGPKVEAPPLPPRDGGWSTMTATFWRDVWASEIAPELIQVDRHGLFVLAELVEQFWEDPDPKLAAEIRLQRQNYGLSPMDRRRLQWEVDRVTEAREKRKKRDERADKVKRKRTDPRKVLRMVKGAK